MMCEARWSNASIVRRSSGCPSHAEAKARPWLNLPNRGSLTCSCKLALTQPSPWAKSPLEYIGRVKEPSARTGSLLAVSSGNVSGGRCGGLLYLGSHGRADGTDQCCFDNIEQLCRNLATRRGPLARFCRFVVRL